MALLEPPLVTLKGEYMQLRKVQLYVTGLLVLVTSFFLCAPRLQANELVYFALQREGQASIAIDKRREAAYIIDLGRGGDGDQLNLDNVPILDRLEAVGIKDLFFVCSYPHSDHMGGIRALFEHPRVFFRHEQLTNPRFKSITVVDNGVPENLFLLLKQSLKNNDLIKINHISAANKNAFAGLSSKEDDVYIENVPYLVADKSGPHGRAVVTYMKLGQKNSIVDFDDADSVTIQKVVKKLMDRGEMQITGFVVPHHGSRYHDIEPILSLKPKYAVISVNPENRYGHPSPPILLALMQKLGKENVVFTGSVENVVLDPNGIKTASFTAANKDSYAMFVSQNRIRAEKKGNKEDLNACALIQKMMVDDGGDSQNRGGAARRLFEEEVKLQNSILQPDFELGAVSFGSDGRRALQSHKIFAYPLASSTAKPGLQDVAIVVEKNEQASTEGSAKLNSSDAKIFLRHLSMSGNEADKTKNIYIYFSSPTGFRDVLEPVLVTSPQEKTKLSTKPNPTNIKPPAPSVSLPSGGMVFLQGDKLFPVGAANELLGGTLDVCGLKFCVKAAGGGTASENIYELPFAPGPLFSEVWARVFDRRISSFYLSINPTKQFLLNLDSRLGQVPSDKLRYGPGLPDLDIRTHEVVTAGEIEKTRIGQILWEADVAFKSAGLGFNVLKGVSAKDNEVTRPSLSTIKSDASDSEVPYEDRWCRLYWASGTQSIGVDKESRKVFFKGDAVIARSEPMRQQGGVLKEAPQGKWCSEPSQIAESLQKEANSRMSHLTVLNQLRDLAEIQSFVRWARDNGLTVTDDFQKRINESNSGSVKEVPKWTSGIKSDPRVQVQEQYLLDESGLNDFLHVRLADASTARRCVLPLWERRKIDFPGEGIKYGEAINGLRTWIIPPGKYQFVHNWMSDLAGKIAECTGGDLLPPIPIVDSNEKLLASKTRGDLGIRPYWQAIQLHGGVLLGVQRGFLESAWRDKGLLLTPGRRPLFQRINGTLHFWSFMDKHPRFGSLGQHVVINDGVVTEAEARDGLLRFFVKTQPGAIVRQELRTSHTNDSTKGFEWAGARHASDGSWIWGKTISPCEGKTNSSSCVRVMDITFDTLKGKIGGGKSIESVISVTRIDESIWLVELNISYICSEFDQRWQKTSASDLSSRLSLIYEYAKWGFLSAAMEKYLEVAPKIEGNTVDTILIKQLVPYHDKVDG